ncbi:MAG: hypothetical protein HC822_19660 [Oscillochloris sp.]|nr:hypothetical protein [Oscillochloris sp.]
MLPTTIDQVIDRLDGIIDTARSKRTRDGFFAALYRTVTCTVKDGIAAGQFDDGERMARLDVVFANRYLEAWDHYRRGNRPTSAWQYSFEVADRQQALVLQHLLLGMNAHINLDLGIAAAAVAPGARFPGLERDFVSINRILQELLDGVQDAIGDVSPVFGVLDRLGLWFDESICNFSMRRARGAAWEAGTRLSIVDQTAQVPLIAELDADATRLAGLIHHPLIVNNPLFEWVYRAEADSIPIIIDRLYATCPRTSTIS